MREDFRIRRAGIVDARAIGALVRRITRRDVLPDQPASVHGLLLETMSARAERGRMREGYRYHVAELGGRIVGVVAVRDDRHLYRLFVAAGRRGLGIGRALWQRALADSRRRAGTRTFTVNASKFAVPVYVRLGFRQAARPRRKGFGLVTTPMVYRVRPSRAASGAKGRS